MVKLIQVLILFWGMFPLFLTGEQTQPWRFQQINNTDGLSQNNVISILRDNHGFMWFGTQDGLNRYDGHRFTVYKCNKQDPDGLTSSSITVLCEDQEGFIWIGTSGGGLNRFDPRNSTFTHFLPEDSDSTSLSSNRILDICEDPLGTLWIATTFGLNARRPGQEGFVRYMNSSLPGKGVSSEYVDCLAIDKVGTLWVGTYWGLDRYDRSRDQFDHYHYGPENRPFPVRHILPDVDGQLWLLSDDKLLRFDSTNGRFLPVPLPIEGLVFNKMQKDDNGRICLSSRRGLYYYDPRNGSFVGQWKEPDNAFGLNADHINTIYQDPDGVLWLGTNRGVNLRLPDISPFFHFRHHPNDPASLSHNFVYCFGEDVTGLIWIGTFNGLNAFDRRTQTFQRFLNAASPQEASADNIIRTLCVNQDGTLWLGTDNGLKHYNPRTGHVQRFDRDFTTPDRSNGLINKAVRILRRHGKGYLWVGTAYGLALLDETKQSFGHFTHDPLNPLSLGGNTISSLLNSYKDETPLWIGTLGGGLSQMRLGRLTEDRTVTFKSFNKSTGLASDLILAIHQDRQGILWLGTPSGLDRLDLKANEVENFSELTGLPNNFIYGILSDNDDILWLSSNRGLIRFDPVSRHFTRFGPSHGVQDEEFNGGAYFKNREGYLFFGGVNGFNCFLPSLIRDKKDFPPIAITSVRILPRNFKLSGIISDGQLLELAHDDALLQVEYAALSYIDSASNRYAYQIEGLHKGWIDQGHNPTLSLSNPGPGSYRLRIKGAGADGIWNEVGISLLVRVTPPFYRTVWFIGFLAIGMAAMVFFLGTTYRKWQIHKVKTVNDLKGFCAKADLSPREQEIVLLILDGKNNKEIEDKLFLAESTVRNHISNIYRKLDINSRAQLVAYFKNYNRM